MRVHPWSLACLALLLLLGLTLGFTGDAAQLARIAAGIALLLGSGLLLRFVGHDRIGGTLECWATFFLFGLFGMFASVVLASTRLPYADALLVRWDAALGFHWLDAWRYFDARPQLFLWTRRIYDTIHWQPFLGIALMFATGQGRRAFAFLTAWISSLLLTLAIFPFFPAVAANAWFHVGTQVALPGRLSWLEILHLSRTGALRVIDSRSIVGLQRAQAQSYRALQRSPIPGSMMPADKYLSMLNFHPAITGTVLSVAYLTPLAADAVMGDGSSFLKELTGSAGAAVMGCFVISILAKLVFVVVDIFKTELTKRDEWIRELISRVGKDE